ncbi:hypothetical protein TRAPUB_11915 [Trametes pubescens]|uniref:Uncharacterized protein n=1 Tax=Trametes pubescens TaxID=154538 RepID=A0A1M2VVL2_TRAPU|nr:hypothetical protein TRAPUB_11915 [Trametes pubescens]
MTKPKSIPSNKRSAALKSRRKPKASGFVIVIETPRDFLQSSRMTQTDSPPPQPTVRAHCDLSPRREDCSEQATKRRHRNWEQQPEEDAQSGAPPKKWPRKRRIEEQKDIQQQLMEPPFCDATASKVGLLPEPDSRDSPSDSSEDASLASQRGAATVPPGKGKKAASASLRGYPHIMGPCGWPPSSEPMCDSLMACALERDLVPITAALLAACEYSNKWGYHPPGDPVSSSRISRPDLGSSRVAAPAPRYRYNAAPRWLVDSPPAESVAPPLEALTPRTVLRIFDEADPRDVDRFVQWCLHLDGQALLSGPLPPAFEGLSDHPHGGVHEDLSPTRHFSERTQDMSFVSPHMSAAYGSLPDDLSGLDWLAPPALPPTSSWALPQPFYFGPSAAPEMAFAYQGEWNVPDGALSAPATLCASWPMPLAFPSSPRSEAALILVDLASGQAGPHAATRADMRQAAAPPNDMPEARLSIPESAESRQRNRG